MMDARVHWEDLPPELLPEIAKHLHTHMDLLRFRGVCKSWRSSVNPPRDPSSSFPLQVPHPSFPSFYAALTLSTFYRIQPTHHYFSSSPKGWLVSHTQKANISLLEGLYKTILNPHPRTVVDMLDYRVVELHKSYSLHDFKTPFNKAALLPTSCLFDVNVEDYMVCSIDDEEGCLALFKRGEDKWTLVGDRNLRYSDVIAYKGRFYVIDMYGTISWIDTCSMELICCSRPSGADGEWRLVESCGSLYIVERYYCYGLAKFRVYRLDEERQTWVDVKDLKDRVFMLGDSGCFSVCANDFYGYIGNCIFYTDAFGVLRVFNLGDGGIIPNNPFDSQLYW